jgi:uncharacterized protein (DUF302 family)
MAVSEVRVQRFSVISSEPFKNVVASLEDQIGRPDMVAFRKAVTEAKTFSELEGFVNSVTGPLGLVEFVRLDLGEILRKQHGPSTPQSVRFLVGNPLIMKKMVECVPDAGSYAPVTILIDERPDVVHLSYDRMASFLDRYGNPAAMQVARDLDSKVEALLTAAAGGR